MVSQKMCGFYWATLYLIIIIKLSSLYPIIIISSIINNDDLCVLVFFRRLKLKLKLRQRK